MSRTPCLHNYSITRATLLFAVALVIGSLALTGCTGTTKAHVRPVPNNGYIALDAEDVVNIMVAAGFTEEEIFETGTDFRNTLGENGGAAIHRGETVKALVACQPPFVYVTTQEGNSFVYDVKTKTMR